MNLGEAQLHQFKIEEGLNAYTQAVNLGDITAPARLLRAKVGMILSAMVVGDLLCTGME